MPEKILGLDIGNESIKAVQVTAGLKGYQVIKSACIDIREAGNIPNALKGLFENGSFENGVCITALPVNKISFRNIKLPFKDKKKISQTIAYELEPLLPYSVEDYIVDYLLIGQDDQSEVFAAVVLKSYMRELAGLLEEKHLEASVIDIGAMSIASKLISAGSIQDTCFLLDIGSRDTAGVFFNDKKVLQIRHYSFGGEIITETIMKALNIEISEAEQRKRSFSGDGVPEEVSEVCDKFFAEVRNTIQSLELNGEIDSGPSKIYLTGGGALYPPLQRKIEDSFSLPVEIVDLAKVDNISLDEENEKTWNPMIMNHALALATRDAKKNNGFNFCVGEFEPKRRYKEFKADFGWVAVLAIIILLVSGIDFYLGYHYDNAHADKLKQEIVDVFKDTLPEVTRIVNPLHQLKVEIAEAKKSSTGSGSMGSSGTVLDVLKNISLEVPRSTDFFITGFTYDGNALEIKGETDNFNTVDNIKKHLEESKYLTKVTISSANLIKKGSRVGFDLKAEF